jgi:peptidoglycan/xylan/chitin deacetylase (PgdA/CDA1 family)
MGIPAVDLADDEARERAAGEFVAYAHGAQLDAAARTNRLAELADRVGVDSDQLVRRRVLRIMTRVELAAVSARGADVQLHTHRHRTPLTRLDFIREIQENRAYLEAATGRPAVHFCYPSGVHHPECLPWLEALGVRSATTCEPSLAQADDSRLMLPRLVDTAALNDVEVEGWLTGVSQCLLQRRTRDALQPMRVAPAEAR